MRRDRSTPKAGWLAAVAALACWAAPTLAQPEASGQKIELALTAKGRTAEATFQPGDIMELNVRMIDLVDGQAVEGLHPSGFIRRTASRNATCAEAAQAYRATGRVALGDIDLSGVTLLVAQDDGMLAAVDPSMSLASANIRWLARLNDAATRLDAGPGGILADGDRLQSVSEIDGSVAALPGLAADARLLSTTSDVTRAFIQQPPNKVVVYDKSAKKVVRKLDAAGTPTIAVDARNRLALLTDGGQRFVILDTTSGHILAKHRLATAGTAIAYSGVADAIIVANGAALTLLHLDAPADLQTIDLAGSATELALSADQRTAFAFDRKSGLLNVVDLARQALVQAVHFPEGIAGLASTQDTVSVLLASRWTVANISTDTLKAGAEPNVTEVALPTAGPPPSSYAGPLILSVGDIGPTLVAQPQTREVYVIPHEPGMRAPTNAIAIRGGAIRSIAVLARTFRPAGDGYSASFSVQKPGRYEAVVSAGLFNASACLAFVVGDPGDPGEEEKAPARLALTLPSEATTGTTVPVEVGLPAGTNRRVDLQVLSAEGNFQDNLTLVATNGIARFPVRFPHPGLFIVTATAGAATQAVDQIEVR